MRDRRLVWLLASLTLLFVAVAWLDVTPWLRGPDEWRWGVRAAVPPLQRLFFPALILAVYVVLCDRWLRAWREGVPRRTVERGFLLFLTLAAPVIQLALAAAVWRNAWFELFGATISPAVTGFHSVAVTTPDLPAQLGHYTQFMPTLPIHPQTHPPGLVLLHWLAWRAFEALPAVSNALAPPLRMLQCHNAALMTLNDAQIASAALGMAVPLLGGLAVWPMYAFGKRIARPQAAAAAVALFPILPMFAMWPGQWDQVYPLLLFGALLAADRGVVSQSRVPFFVAGGLLSLATFLSVGNAVLMVIVAAYCALALWRSATRDVRRMLWAGVAYAVGCAAIWIVYAVLYGVGPSEVVATGSRLLFESTRCPMCPSTTRSYAVWLLWNPLDMAIFFSVPLTILLVARLPSIVRAMRAFVRGPAPRWAALAIVVVAVFLLLIVSGIVRGEVSRIFAYFGPLFALIALAADERPSPDSRLPVVLVGLVALQLAVMGARWHVAPSFLDEPPERVANLTPPDPQFDLHASFDGQIALTGYDVNLMQAGQPSRGSLDVTLHWQALAQPPHAYTVFVHVLDAAGRQVAQRDNMPVRNQLPTSCWQPGEFVADPYAIDLPPDAPGPLTLRVGLYRLDTGQRLLLDDGSGDSVQLAVP